MALSIFDMAKENRQEKEGGILPKQVAGKQKVQGRILKQNTTQKVLFSAVTSVTTLTALCCKGMRG
jgi:hypothetical protein